MNPFTSARWSGRNTAFAATLALSVAAMASARAGTWDDAQRAFADYNDPAGLALLQQAAQEGDARAMQAWGLALLHGPKLFPGRLQADTAQARIWLDKLAQHCVVAAAPVAAPVESACPPPRALRLASRPL